MDRPPILGTRGSPLALAQARLVASALETLNGWPPGHVVIRPVKTSGDRIQDRPLAEIGGKSLWTKELDLALLSGETDLSVHSMKDVESERPRSLVIAAMLERADVRDRIIGAPSVKELPQFATVGTSSPRRAAQLLSLRPDVRILPIRGNVATRLAKLENGEFHATFLACAGLDRLGKSEIGTPVPVSEMLPAPGQAAIGIECRADDASLRELLGAIDHKDTHAAVIVERAFARALGGSCHSPVGALAVVTGNQGSFRAQLLSKDGSEQVTAHYEFEADGTKRATELAQRMLQSAAPEIQALFGAG